MEQILSWAKNWGTVTLCLKLVLQGECCSREPQDPGPPAVPLPVLEV